MSPKSDYETRSAVVLPSRWRKDTPHKLDCAQERVRCCAEFLQKEIRDPVLWVSDVMVIDDSDVKRGVFQQHGAAMEGLCTRHVMRVGPRGGEDESLSSRPETTFSRTLSKPPVEGVSSFALPRHIDTK